MRVIFENRAQITSNVRETSNSSNKQNLLSNFNKGKVTKHVIHNCCCSHNFMASWYGYFVYYGWINSHSSRNCCNCSFVKRNFREEATLAEDNQGLWDRAGLHRHYNGQGYWVDELAAKRFDDKLQVVFKSAVGIEFEI